MDHRLLHQTNPNLTLALLCAAMLAGLACASEPKRQTVSGAGGAGGAGGSGAGGTASGGAPEGGSGGSGGVTSETGGGGQGGTAPGGSGGTIPVIACTSDGECAASGLFCEPALKRCVRCVTTSNCQEGAHCRGNECVTPTACESGADCATKNLVCDPTRGFCVECVSAGDCAAEQTCVGNRCVAVCKSASDCPAEKKVCDTASGKCVGCTGDADCTNSQRCVQSVCRTACTSAEQCAAQGLLCDTSTSACVQCAAPADCPASSYCIAGACVPDICDATESMCTGTGFVSCNAAGSGWTNLTPCPSGVTCVAKAGVASCSGGPPIDGGSVDSPSQVCSTATVDPCTSIAQFTGTQVLDGNGDDLCTVPSFQFGFQSYPSAGRLININGAPQDRKEIVTGRVGWGTDGLHLFFDVTDPSVQTTSMKDPNRAITDAYRGDSLEIYFSSNNNNLTGLTGTDTNTMYVIIPATGPAVSVKVNNNNGASTATPTELNKSYYVQKSTSTGYAIEALLPWPSGGPPASGSTIRFDLILNSADSNTYSVDDMRDGQLIYHIETLTTGSSCQGSNDGPVPYCDNRTWCATTLQ